MIESIWNYAYEYCKRHGVDDNAIEYWKSLPKPSEITDRFFIEELAWCIFNSGFRESVIRAKWDSIRSTFMLFDIDSIISHELDITAMMEHVFNNKRKICAVIECAKKVKTDSPISSKLSNMTEEAILDYLESYPYIGKITKYHIARNIGVDCVKPDRHLVKLADNLGYQSPNALVNEISRATGEKKGFIDYILWQWLSWEGKAAYDAVRFLSRNKE